MSEQKQQNNQGKHLPGISKDEADRQIAEQEALKNTHYRNYLKYKIAEHIPHALTIALAAVGMALTWKYVLPLMHVPLMLKILPFLGVGMVVMLFYMAASFILNEGGKRSKANRSLTAYCEADDEIERIQNRQERAERLKQKQERAESLGGEYVFVDNLSKKQEDDNGTVSLPKTENRDAPGRAERRVAGDLFSDGSRDYIMPKIFGDSGDDVDGSTLASDKENRDAPGEAEERKVPASSSRPSTDFFNNGGGDRTGPENTSAPTLDLAAPRFSVGN